MLIEKSKGCFGIVRSSAFQNTPYFLSGMHFKVLKTPKTKRNKMSETPCISLNYWTISVQVIAAEGEQKSSMALKEAADIIKKSPAALQLRYLQVGTTSLQAVASASNCADSELDLRREELDHHLPAADGDRKRIYRAGRGVWAETPSFSCGVTF